jgi:hypothetical protein
MSPLARRSAVIIPWPIAFEVTLEIDPNAISSEETVGTVGVRLVQTGGRFVAWRQESDRQPARAQFKFSRAADRDRFVAKALKIPGVSVATA